MLMVGMILKVSLRTLGRWLRLFAVVVGAVFLTAVSFVVQACGAGTRHPDNPEDAGRDAGADAGRDAGVDAGRDAEVPRDAEVIRDADLPDVPLE